MKTLEGETKGFPFSYYFHKETGGRMSIEHFIGIGIIVLAYSGFCILVFYSNKIVEKIYKSDANTLRQIKRVLRGEEGGNGRS